MPVRYFLFFVALALGTLAVPAAVGVVNSQNTAADSTTTASLPQQMLGTPLPGAFDQTVIVPNEMAETTTTVSALGTIEANQTAEVSFRLSGEIAEIMVEPGDSVAEGDLLAWLDATDEQIAYDQARLNVERAQINLDELYEPPDDSTLRVADANIASAQASYSSAANTDNDTEVEAAQLRYQQAQNTYDTEVAVRAHMNGTEEELALQDAAVGAASFNLEIARLQLEDLQTPDTSNLWSAGVRIRQAQLSKEELLAGPTQSDIDSAELSVRRAKLQLNEAESSLRKTRAYAPISGVVTKVNVDPGESIGTDTVVIEIMDNTKLWLDALVHEVDIDQLTTGMPASIILDALSDLEISATVEEVSWLSTVEDDIVYYDTRFAILTDDPRIRVGMTAQVVVEIEN